MAGYVVLGKQYVSNEEKGGDPGAFLLCRQLIACALMMLIATARHGLVWPEHRHYARLHILGCLNFFNAIGFVWVRARASAPIARSLPRAIVPTAVHPPLTPWFVRRGWP